MINQQLLNPKSIVVIGGSNNVHKPGGSIVRNIKNGGFGGDLHIVNPKEDEVQGIKGRGAGNKSLSRREGYTTDGTGGAGSGRQVLS